MRTVLLSALLLIVCTTAPVSAAAPDHATAAAALQKAVRFFNDDVSVQGGYLWRYSADLTRREGEREATESMAWVQPPGTPSVGDAILLAWELTGDPALLEAARQSGLALVKTQLQSGGWDHRIVFDEESRKGHAYRADGRTTGRNVSTLDDDSTQAALRFLMRLDRALKFRDKRIHEAARYGLEQLLAVQYPSGGWPQRYSGPPDPEEYPVRRASFPKDWSRTFPNVNYASFYTLNDNAIADATTTLIEASKTYNEPRYLEAAKKAGDFLILAQLPEPQPAWAQQYNAEMHPAWARRFEPPAVTGGESQGALLMLLELYRETGEKRFLEPVPRALAYLRRSLLPDGRIARFYELETNRPLYFTKEYELTYSDADMPTHYGFIQRHKLDRIEREYQQLLNRTPEPAPLRQPRPPRMTPQLEQQVAEIIAGMDDRGAWVERGSLRSAPDVKQIISTQTFIQNVRTLAGYVAATRPKQPKQK